MSIRQLLLAGSVGRYLVRTVGVESTCLGLCADGFERTFNPAYVALAGKRTGITRLFRRR